MGNQCDQMVEFKVAQFFTKMPQKVDTAVFTQIVTFFKYLQNSTYTWATFERKFVKISFKIVQSGHTVWL